MDSGWVVNGRTDGQRTRLRMVKWLAPDDTARKQKASTPLRSSIHLPPLSKHHTTTMTMSLI